MQRYPLPHASSFQPRVQRGTADGTSHSSVGSTEQSVIQSLAYRIQIRVGVLRTSLQAEALTSFCGNWKISFAPSSSPTHPSLSYLLRHSPTVFFLPPTPRLSVIMFSRYSGYGTMAHQVRSTRMMLKQNRHSVRTSNTECDKMRDVFQIYECRRTPRVT